MTMQHNHYEVRIVATTEYGRHRVEGYLGGESFPTVVLGWSVTRYTVQSSRTFPSDLEYATAVLECYNQAFNKLNELLIENDQRQTQQPD